MISRKTKLQIFNTNVKSVLLFGSETWRVIKATSNKLQAFVNRCLRSIIGIHWPEDIRKEELWARAEQKRIEVQIRRRKWCWIGTPSESQPATSSGIYGSGTYRGRGAKAAQGTAEGKPWTTRWARQATSGGRSRSQPKTERDGGRFSWTYAP